MPHSTPSSPFPKNGLMPKSVAEPSADLANMHENKVEGCRQPAHLDPTRFQDKSQRSKRIKTNLRGSDELGYVGCWGYTEQSRVSNEG